MRINPAQQKIIKKTIALADPDAKVYLFGSRVNDDSMGGDIDLLVLSTQIDMMSKISLLAKLHQSLGDQKIDLAVYADASRPFAKIVIENAVPL